MDIRPWLVALLTIAGCGSGEVVGDPPSTSSALPLVTPTATTQSVTTPVIPPARTARWIDLRSGQCLRDPAPTDPSVVDVTLVDCSAPHQAEVVGRVPLSVDEALADVAKDKCGRLTTSYATGPATSNRLAVTYLIDSEQDRTADNPQPSTVICLLQSVTGQPTTGSARR